MGGIDKQVRVLASSATDEKRPLALKYVVHLVGDIHQPLHAGYAEDRGGNSYQLQAFMRGSNLHALWDTGLIRNTGEDATTMSKRLITQSLRVPQSFNAVQVAQESCAILAKPEFYPERTVGLGYVQKYTPVMEHQLIIAGTRLESLLNRIFP